MSYISVFLYEKEELWPQHYKRPGVLQSKNGLESKQKDLKKKGKGGKPNASAPLTEQEVKLLYDKELLGKLIPGALLNTIWFNNTVHFGLGGC